MRAVNIIEKWRLECPTFNPILQITKIASPKFQIFLHLLPFPPGRNVATGHLIVFRKTHNGVARPPKIKKSKLTFFSQNFNVEWREWQYFLHYWPRNTSNLAFSVLKFFFLGISIISLFFIFWSIWSKTPKVTKVTRL